MSRKPEWIEDRKAFPVSVRKAVAERSGGICEIEGCDAEASDYDHFLPVAFGGESTLENCRHLCREHNAAKGRVEAKMAIRADKMGGRIGQQARRKAGKTAKIAGRGFDTRLKRKLPTKKHPHGQTVARKPKA